MEATLTRVDESQPQQLVAESMVGDFPAPPVEVQSRRGKGWNGSILCKLLQTTLSQLHNCMRRDVPLYRLAVKSRYYIS
jgi:hypothetical protein